jgi:hypothetical protein
VFEGLAPPLTLSCPRHPSPYSADQSSLHTPPPSLPTISGHHPHSRGLRVPTHPGRATRAAFLRILGPRAERPRRLLGRGRPSPPGPSGGPFKSGSLNPLGLGGQKLSPLPSVGPRPRSPLPHRGRAPGGLLSGSRPAGRRLRAAAQDPSPLCSRAQRPPTRARAPASRAPSRPGPPRPSPSPSPGPGPHSRLPRAPARSRSAPLRRLPPLTGPSAPTPWHRAPLRALPPPPGLSPPPPLPSRPPPSRSPAPLLLRRRRRRLLRLLLPGCSGSLQLDRRPGPRGCHHHVARGGGPRGAVRLRLAARRAPTSSPPCGLPSPPTGAVSADRVLGRLGAGLGVAHFGKKWSCLFGGNIFIFLLVFGEETSLDYVLFALVGRGIEVIYLFEHRDIRVKSNFESERELRR